MQIPNLVFKLKRTALQVLMCILQSKTLFPIRKNRILISTHKGFYYSDNPKYISEYLVKHHGTKVEIIWAFANPKKYSSIQGIRTVKYKSPAWLYYAATTSVVITNLTYSLGQPKKQGQMFINTWHGGGAYKKIAGGTNYPMTETDRCRRSALLQNTDLFLSSSEAFTAYAIRKDYGYKGEVLPCGMPRNDIFFDEKKRDAIARKVRNILGLNGFIALYAPTHRGDKFIGYCTNFAFPYRDLLPILRQRFGNTAVILKRAHPGGRMTDAAISEVVDVTDYPDMQELLCAADMLITDYSSSIWDFALLGRPCLLYIPDLKEYIEDRGLHTLPEEWPGIVCKDEKELLNAAVSFDLEECRQKALLHLKALGSYETGTAAEQVCERILQHMG